MQQPETLYTKVGNDHVAYQVLGDGPIDLVTTMGQWGHLDLEWEEPAVARFLTRLASFTRLIRFDCRGSGLSDPRPDGSDVSRCWNEDLLAVMKAASSESVAIFGWIDGGQLALEFAALYPDKVRSLILMSTAVRYSAAPDYPEGNTPEAAARFLDFCHEHWGTEKWAVANSPSLANEELARRWYAKWQRAMGPPRAIVSNFEQQQKWDVRPILPDIQAPVLALARGEQRQFLLAQAHHVVDQVDDGQLVEIGGADVQPFWENPEQILGHIEEFLTGIRRGNETERALLTVLFTDIVNSTPLAAKMGDTKWHALLNRHDEISREQILRFGGNVIERTGDGTLATFERPGSAIECAQALHHAMESLNIEIRAGLHTAEMEIRQDGRVGGINVHVGARVMAQANAGEVLVSQTVQNILLGSRYQFEDRGSHTLKGVPGEWTLFAVRI